MNLLAGLQSFIPDNSLIISPFGTQVRKATLGIAPMIGLEAVLIDKKLSIEYRRSSYVRIDALISGFIRIYRDSSILFTNGSLIQEQQEFHSWMVNYKKVIFNNKPLKLGVGYTYIKIDRYDPNLYHFNFVQKVHALTVAISYPFSLFDFELRNDFYLKGKNRFWDKSSIKIGIVKNINLNSSK